MRTLFQVLAAGARELRAAWQQVVTGPFRAMLITVVVVGLTFPVLGNYAWIYPAFTLGAFAYVFLIRRGKSAEPEGATQ